MSSNLLVIYPSSNGHSILPHALVLPTIPSSCTLTEDGNTMGIALREKSNALPTLSDDEIIKAITDDLCETVDEPRL